MKIVDLMDKYDIGYCSVNHNRNRCMDCGYENAKQNMKKCPHCGSEKIDQLQRITGYLVGTTNRWNSGKLAELRDRVVHEQEHIQKRRRDCFFFFVQSTLNLLSFDLNYLGMGDLYHGGFLQTGRQREYPDTEESG